MKGGKGITPPPAEAKSVLADTIANAHLRERNDLLEAEVEHARNLALGYAHRLSQMGEPTTYPEYGEVLL